jgi:hypothetical protein
MITLGGIIGPKAPPAASNPAAEYFLYPTFNIEGYNVDPTAATVAGPEPVKAANKVQDMIVIIPILPFKCPKYAWIQLTSLLEIEVLSITNPVKINIDIANIGNESIPVIIRCATTISGLKLVITRNPAPDKMRLKAIGTPINIRPKRNINNKTVMSLTPFPNQFYKFRKY